MFRVIDIDTNEIIALFNVNETYVKGTDPFGPITTRDLCYLSIEGVDWPVTDLLWIDNDEEEVELTTEQRFRAAVQGMLNDGYYPLVFYAQCHFETPDRDM